MFGINVFISYSRVHITQATLDCLNGEYEIEAGHGATRNQYLRDNNVTTYFIVPPARRRKVYIYFTILQLNVNEYILFWVTNIFSF